MLVTALEKEKEQTYKKVRWKAKLKRQRPCFPGEWKFLLSPKSRPFRKDKSHS